MLLASGISVEKSDASLIVSLEELPKKKGFKSIKKQSQQLGHEDIWVNQIFLTHASFRTSIICSIGHRGAEKMQTVTF